MHALPETIEALRQHVMNWGIWPDFTQLPSKTAPVLRFEPLSVGQELYLGGRRIEVLPAEHTVPAVGYQHLAPRLLAHELRTLAPQVPVYITHMKPGEQAQVASELAGLDSHRILPLETGQVFHL